MSLIQSTEEHIRIAKNATKEIPLELWGPYLSERQWGTVREDYSKNGDAWSYFPHEHARSRVYRWGEDGLGGISDINQHLCFAWSFWNGKDPILKERLFGLSNPEGSHGEDVKELYYHLDNIPTHYYMKYLFKYAQAEYPYNMLLEMDRTRGKKDPEFELLDTGIFNEDQYFDIVIEYAKENSEDIYIRLTITNRGAEKAPLTILPTLWYFNNWNFEGEAPQPTIQYLSDQSIQANNSSLGNYYLYFPATEHILFTDNETNFEKLFHIPNPSEFVKDAFHEAIIHGTNFQRLIDRKRGTKCAPVFHIELEGGTSTHLVLRLSSEKLSSPFPQDFEKIFEKRKKEADDFYETIYPKTCTEDQKNILRQAFAGMLWNKQYYHYDVERWLHTTDGISPFYEERLHGRNATWKYLKNQDILSMPDNWEYPWYAAWDTAFHCITLAIVDPLFAKHQLVILMREWYMDPKGQLPAYEWDFNDVNPPVHAFAALQVYRVEKRMTGKGDVDFLKTIFQKLIINFTWWINRKDADGNSIFEGGFLGLDNIGIFDRSKAFPGGLILEQADGTSWMGMYALDMMDIALEIAIHDNTFEDAATKFYEHFVIIAEALNELGLWSEEDGFFYDVLSLNSSDAFALKIRSIVGLSPMFAVSVIEKEVFDKLPDFTKRINWFTNYRIKNKLFLPSVDHASDESVLLSMVSKQRLSLLLEKLLDESEFLSKGGIRALSKYYQDHPYSLDYEGTHYSIEYDPGDATTEMFGGNSNWRGPVWIPINYLFIRAFNALGYFYEDDFLVEYPFGSGTKMNLTCVAEELTQRLLSIFEKNEKNERPLHGNYNWFYQRPGNEDLILFYEYFHGDTSRGLGASHQTGWTALIANLLLRLKNKPEYEPE